jgi:cold-inducible RNA-binding protein
MRRSSAAGAWRRRGGDHGTRAACRSSELRCLAAPADRGKVRAAHPVPLTSATRRSRAISSKVFVGNLSFDTTRDQLLTHLAEAGEILDVFIPTDRATGKPRGFAFVEFSSSDEAQAAISKFDGSDLGGRNLRINMADDRPPRPAFGGGGGGGGFGGGGGGFGGGGGGGFGGGGGGGGGFGNNAPPKGAGKSKGSRRGLRGKKRSL